MSTVEDVAEVCSWHWRQGSDDEPFCAFDAQDWPCSTARLLDRLERAERQVAAVEALADEWEDAAAKPRPNRAEGESAQDDGVRIGVWHSVRTAATELRAALATEEQT